jgi:hypothetical protein
MTTFSDPILIIFGTFLLHQFTFWISNGIILLLTYVIYPNHSKKYKIQKVIFIKNNKLISTGNVFFPIGCSSRFTIS